MESSSSINNSAFQNLLMLMSKINTQEELDELKDIILAYFAKRVDEDMDKLWDDGTINQDTINTWSNQHMRTPYHK